MGYLVYMTTTLTGHNQITIPASLAKKFSLKPGSRVEWVVGEAPDEMICRVLPDPSRISSELRGAGRKYLKKGKTHPIEALMQDRLVDDTGRAECL
jgi:bifunctional DNA-binding transcriptional regulator/antitoxin component of YhaV-PrlF toxin-antitoxin module